MFGTKHLIVLATCVAYILGALLLLKRKKPALKAVVRILLGIGILSETLKVFSYVAANEAEYNGYLPKTDLPFHLCSVQIIFMLILVLSNSERVKRVLYAFMLPTCLIGGAAAMLLPTSSSLNMPVITVQYFLYHSSIVAFAVYLFMTDEIRFTVKDYASALLMLYAMFFVAIYLNSWVNDGVHNINFMYVVAPPMEGLPFLNKDHGWLVYMIHYTFLAVACVTACYGKPIVSAIVARIKKKTVDPQELITK